MVGSGLAVPGRLCDKVFRVLLYRNGLSLRRDYKKSQTVGRGGPRDLGMDREAGAAGAADGDLLTVLQGNFDEMASLRKELGDGMDDLFASIMGGLSTRQRPSALRLRVSWRIDMLDALDEHSQKIDAMAAGSPKRHAFGFEEVIAEMRARLRELRGKCGGISASALPLFQIKCVEEEMVSIERDVAGLPREMEATFARRMSFQVSLAAVATSTERVLAFRDRKALALMDAGSGDDSDEEGGGNTQPSVSVADTFRLTAERQGMLSAEKEQRLHGDNFFGADMIMERRAMRHAEIEQCSHGDTFSV